jgi:hypothetical protein
MHEHLRQKVGTSFLDQTSPAAQPLQGRLGSTYDPVKYSSQWMTVTIEAAWALSADEAGLREKWEWVRSPWQDYLLRFPSGAQTYGALDEWIWNSEFSQRNLPFERIGLTSVLWDRHALLGEDCFVLPIPIGIAPTKPTFGILTRVPTIASPSRISPPFNSTWQVTIPIRRASHTPSSSPAS